MSPALESGWVVDGFGHYSVVGVVPWVVTGGSASALFAGTLAFGVLRLPCHMEWPQVGALVSSATRPIILAPVPDMGVPQDCSPPPWNCPQLLNLPS